MPSASGQCLDEACQVPISYRGILGSWSAFLFVWR
nr:MAG TPA: hypothetical protein [Caudoviricetes sp.]DAM43901.1 MAG TPA: hypothetical protein [Caudoviricetes sp.]DAW38944.1 MAG TPA: hypothetical protein [Caudoviricetes sp.]